MSDLHQNFIAGEWITGAGVTRNINPSNTGDVVGEYAQADGVQHCKPLRRPKPLRRNGHAPRRKNVMTSRKRFPMKFWHAKRSWDGFWRAKKVRPCQRALAR
jgi:hypothetical protein